MTDTDLAAALARAEAAEARVRNLEAALAELITGAEQQSQSHADVAAACRDALRQPPLGVEW